MEGRYNSTLLCDAASKLGGCHERHPCTGGRGERSWTRAIEEGTRPRDSDFTITSLTALPLLFSYKLGQPFI